MVSMTIEKVSMFEQVTVKQLLEAGVHFGHQTRRWNPKMAEYIFTDRNGVYIIDLEKSLKHLATTCVFLRELAEKGGIVLLVGTKRQAQDSIFQAAEKTGMPYVNQRWLGGMLTNFETVRRSVTRLEELETMEAEGTYQFITKKEVSQIRKQREKLVHVLGGVRHMKRLPDALFVVDPSQETIAVLEARRLGIPVAALIDTNCNPDLIDYLIPGNDDAIRSVKLICEIVSEALKEGRDRYDQHAIPFEEEKEATPEPEAQVSKEVLPEAASPTEEVETKTKVDEIVEVLEEKVVEKLVDVKPPKLKLLKKAKPRKTE